MFNTPIRLFNETYLPWDCALELREEPFVQRIDNLFTHLHRSSTSDAIQQRDLVIKCTAEETVDNKSRASPLVSAFSFRSTFYLLVLLTCVFLVLCRVIFG